MLVTGRRHTFALPIAKQLGFDLWLISSNGAVTRSLSGEDVSSRHDAGGDLPADCVGRCKQFRGNTVLTFDKEIKGAIVLERLDELGASIRRWLEKNMEYIEFVVPIENALVSDPVQAMFCGTMARMSQALQSPEQAPEWMGQVTVLRTEYPERDLSMIDVLNRGLLQGTCAGAVGQPPRLPARRGHGRR